MIRPSREILIRRIAPWLVPAALALAGLSAVQAQTRPPADAAGKSQAQASATAQTSMIIRRLGATPAGKGEPEHFTGSVRREVTFAALPPGRMYGSIGTFEPGARTFWHSHALGQTLIVSSGIGWTQIEGGPVEVMRAGDIVTVGPNVKHWHGATATNAMTHIAIVEGGVPNAVTWLEQVSDAQYLEGGKARP